MPCSPGLGTGVDTGRLLGAQPHIRPYLRRAALPPRHAGGFQASYRLAGTFGSDVLHSTDKLPAGSLSLGGLATETQETQAPGLNPHCSTRLQGRRPAPDPRQGRFPTSLESVVGGHGPTNTQTVEHVRSGAQWRTHGPKRRGHSWWAPPGLSESLRKMPQFLFHSTGKGGISVPCHGTSRHLHPRLRRPQGAPAAGRRHSRRDHRARLTAPHAAS